jgi:hypothetical protein
MDDAHKLLLMFAAAIAAAGSIGLAGILGDRRSRRRQKEKHRDRAIAMQGRGWQYEAERLDNFRLKGRSRYGVSWTLYADGGHPEDASESTVWSTNRVYSPNIVIYLTKRSVYDRSATWTAHLPPSVRRFCQSAKELRTVSAGKNDYVVLAADEALGYQIFGRDTNAAHERWLEAWRSAKLGGNSFVIQLGEPNLQFSADVFIDSPDTLEAMITLGETVAEAYLTTHCGTATQTRP